MNHGMYFCFIWSQFILKLQKVEYGMMIHLKELMYLFCLNWIVRPFGEVRLQLNQDRMYSMHVHKTHKISLPHSSEPSKDLKHWWRSVQIHKSATRIFKSHAA